MNLALAQAKKAAEIGETPVGAVVALGNQVIGEGYNRVEIERDPTAHAEIIALNQARKFLGAKFLNGAELYSTLEPCPLCAAAALLYRVERIVYGAHDLRWGACGTLFNLVQDERFNHRIEVISGVMEEECARILRDFYEGLRGA